jgi:hypothetical protein
MSRERLLVTKATEIQLQLAVSLLRQVVTNLTVLRFGVEPSLTAARKALAEAERSYVSVEELIKRIPEHS